MLSLCIPFVVLLCFFFIWFSICVGFFCFLFLIFIWNFLNVFSLLPLPSLLVSFSMAQMASRLLGALASFLAVALRLFLSWLADPCPAAALSSCQAHMVSFRPAPQSLVSFALP